MRQRDLIEKYIARHHEFLTSLVPIALKSGAPDITRDMAAAAEAAEVGPMAAVAGAIAQYASGAAMAHGAVEAIVENGGDIFFASPYPVTIGLFAGKKAAGKLGDSVALKLVPEQMPVSICSSSSTMGHSLSFGNCDLALVISKSGALADAAATATCNSIKAPEDIEPALVKAMKIPGVLAALAVKDDTVGMIGDLPELVKNADSGFKHKISHDLSWDQTGLFLENRIPIDYP